MSYFLLSSLSLMALIIMLTASLFIISLLRMSGKADYKKWLLIYFVSLFIWHGMGFLSGGLHSDLRELSYRYTNTFFNIGLCLACFSLVQIAYLFPEKVFNKECQRVFYIFSAISAIYISLIIWYHFIRNQGGLSSHTYGQFVNSLAGLYGMLTAIWVVIIYIRKSLYFQQLKSKSALPSGLLAICTAFTLIISLLFVFPGAANPLVMLIYTYGVWILIQAQVFIFIIYSVFPIRFQDKLIGFTFACVMAILSVTAMVIVPFTDNSDNTLNIAQRLVDQHILIKLTCIVLGSATFILLIFPVILRVSLIQPLERLMVGIRQADEGDLSVQVPYVVLDEIGIVTRNFNRMAKSLKQSKDQLTQYANTLEHQVADRTSELKQSLEDLKSTQTQLIQSEKMASLGDLTAGIAHEIQNPLNFVNNFSEVSMELIEEVRSEKLKAKSERSEELENELLDDISQNLQKISHHGKRADAIVKGMLQHSRTSTGEKQATNINTLADEFFKLSYHGLRAKDKSFNAELVTNFDKNLPKINVVQQDIGRVLLNLFNNAFYAVQEKRKAEGLKQNEEYKPGVEVSTSIKDGFVVITVRDNGCGIPEEIKDKIMQPFFTTKPTGEGTGLGLSLSYDIVKAHGGEIKVEIPSGQIIPVRTGTGVRAGLSADRHGKEGEGSEFIIHLPVK